MLQKTARVAIRAPRRILAMGVLVFIAAAVFGVTLMIQQDTKPPLSPGDPASSVLNRVEYGNRG